MRFESISLWKYVHPPSLYLCLFITYTYIYIYISFLEYVSLPPGPVYPFTDKLAEMDKYNWRQPGLHEHVWKDAFEAAGAGSRFRFLNVSFVDGRADAHVGNAMFYSDSEWQRGWGHAFSPKTGN